MRQFKKVIIVVVLLIAFLAIQDIQGMKLWQTIGGWDGEAYQKAQPEYMKLFWSFAIALGVLISGAYYLFRKDLSESLAILATYLLLIWGGLEDLFFYIFQGMQLDKSMPWLMNNLYLNRISTLIGETTVTPLVLILGVASSATIAFYLTRWLKRQRW